MAPTAVDARRHRYVAVADYPKKVQRRHTGWVTFLQLTAFADGQGRQSFMFDLQAGLELSCHLGDGPALTTDGYGGWEETARPRRKPMTEWTGGHLYRMQVPILVSQWFSKPEGSIESRLRRLEQMGRSDQGDDEPSPIAVLLPGDSPINRTNYVWQIEGIEWGAARRRHDGHRSYQEATVSVVEFVRPDLVKLTPSRKNRKVTHKAPKQAPRRSRKFAG